MTNRLLPAYIPERMVPKGLKVYERVHWHKNHLPKFVISTEDGYSLVDYRDIRDVMAFLKAYQVLKDLGMLKEI